MQVKIVEKDTRFGRISHVRRDEIDPDSIVHIQPMAEGQKTYLYVRYSQSPLLIDAPTVDIIREVSRFKSRRRIRVFAMDCINRIIAFLTSVSIVYLTSQITG